MKLEKATKGDIILSLIIPSWGLLVGLIALIKRESRRGLTMISLSVLMIAVVSVVRLVVKLNEKPADLANVSSPSIEAVLLSTANEVTRSAPQMIDAETRLDGAVAGPGLTFTYLYTLPNLESSQVQPGVFDASFTPKVKKAACASNYFSSFFDLNVTVKLEYRGKSGSRIGAIILDRKTCGT